MIIKINGEQPFQVLSTTFSIGPSSSGYDLMASADGSNYSKLFTVGANVNRQVTQVAAGSYYLLSGNTDSAVTVNWFGNCVDGNGGGGGSYTLPVATASRLGGIKVGSGLTIDSGGTLTVSGGTAEEAPVLCLTTTNPDDFTSGDTQAVLEMFEYLKTFSGGTLPAVRLFENGTYWQLVSFESDQNGEGLFSFAKVDIYAYHQIYFDIELDEGTLTLANVWKYGENLVQNYVPTIGLDDIDSPEEGMMAIEETKEKEVTYQHIYVTDGEQYPTEGFWAKIYNVDNDDPDYYRGIYMSSNHFYWDWGNEINGKWQSGSWDGNTYKYRINRDDNEASGTTFDILFPEDSPLYVEVDQDAVDAIEIEDITETVYEYSQPQIYQNQEWIPLYWIIDKDELEVSSAHTAELVTNIRDMVERGRYPMIKGSQNFYNFSEDVDWALVFKSTGNNWGESRTLYISDVVFDDNGFNGYGIREDEDNYYTPYQYTIGITSAGTFTNTDEFGKFSEEHHMDQIWFRWNSDVQDSLDWGQAPLKYIYRRVENIDDEDKLVYYWGAEIPINGTIYRGTWHCIEWDWGNYTTDSWAALS